jgi:hypothetical protein
MASETMSPSFPYRWIAQRFGLDYGTVLSYSDAEEKEPAAWTVTERRATDVIDVLPPAILEALLPLMDEARLRRVSRGRGA